MGLIEWFNRFGKAVADRTPLAVLFGLPTYDSKLVSGEDTEVLKNIFSIVYKCIDKRATETSAGEWCLYRPDKQGDDGYAKVDQHPVLDILNRPHPEFSKMTLLYFIQGYLDACGEAFLFMERTSTSRMGQVSGLSPLRPDFMQIKFDAAGNIIGYEYKVGAKVIDFKPQEILHIKRPNLENPARGMSIIRASGYEIDAHKKMHQSRLSLMDNDSTPPYVLQSDQSLTDAQIGRVQEQIQARYAGPTKRGKALVLGGGLKAQPLPVSHEDLMYLAGIGANEKSIQKMFGVPAAVMGDVTDFNRANADAARVIFLAQTVQPETMRLADSVTHGFLPIYNIPDWKLELEIDIPKDRQALVNEIQVELNSGVVSINEARSQLGLDKYDSWEADLLWIGLGRMPLEQGQTPAPRPAAPPVTGPNPPAGDNQPEDDAEDDQQPANEPQAPKGWMLHKGWRVHDVRAREAMVKGNTRKQMAYEKSTKRLMNDWFDSQARKVKAELRKAYKSWDLAEIAKEPAPHLDALIPDSITEAIRLAAIMEPAMQDVLRDFSLDAAERYGANNWTFDPQIQSARNWLGQRLVERMQRINEDTAAGLRSTLQEGILQSETIDQLGDRVAGFFNQQKDYRSERIARTEVIGASNRGTFAGLEASGVQYKDWVSAGDDGRTRETHLEADATYQANPIPIDEPFIVGGVELMHPGDMLATGPDVAGEVINCRCALGAAFPADIPPLTFGGEGE